MLNPGGKKKKRKAKQELLKTLKNSCGKVCPMQELYLIYFHS